MESYKKLLKVGIDRQKRGVYLEIELRLREGNYETIDHRHISEYIELAISGYAQRRYNSDYSYAGQIQDELNDKNIARWLIPKSQVEQILTIWKKFHLNGLNAGCIHQIRGDYSNPDISGQVCPETGYKYGTAWLVRELPQSVIETVKSW